MNKKCLMIGAIFTMTIASQSFAADLKIGVAQAFTGPNASYGIGAFQGAKLAADSINAKGGINGNKLILLKEDDACDPKQAVSIARKLAEQDKVIAVVGHLCSSSTIPAFDIYNEADVLAITPASTSPEITNKGYHNVFRVIGRDDQQALAASDYVIKKGFKKIVILHDKDSYGKSLAEQFKKGMNVAGIKELLFDGINPGEKNYSSIVTKIRALKPDVLYWGGYYAEAAVLIKEMREQNIQALLIGGDSLYATLPEVLADKKLTANVYAAFQKDFSKLPENKAVIEEFAKNKIEGSFALASYAAIQVIAQAMSHVKDPTNVKMLSDYIHANTFDTVQGKVSFDAKGDLQQATYVLYRYEGTKMVEAK